MKIITDKEVYVQKNDIAYLNQTDLPILASVLTKLLDKGIIIIDNSNRYEFVKFDKPEEIEYFKKLDWIVDYNEVKDLTEEEILSLAQSIHQERETIAHKYNSMKPEERENHPEMVRDCDLLGFKIYSLRNILWFKQGHIKMTLPEGIDLPKFYVPFKEVEDTRAKKGPKLIRKIFPKLKF